MKRKRASRPSRAVNAPPLGAQWFWITRDMLMSASWRAMPRAARRIVDRVILEHMAHGGTRNGDLTVTYDNFGAYGLSSRRETGKAIRVAVALGFLDVTAPGRKSYGGARLASRYGLTWVPRCDRTLASNRWRSVHTLEEAKTLIRAAAEARKMPDARVSSTRRRLIVA